MDSVGHVSWFKHAGIMYGVYVWITVAAHRICVCPTLLENAKLFSKWSYQFAQHLVADVVV